MGPSWYVMPEVFEHYFSLLGENIADHLNLIKLHPSYKVFFKDQNQQVEVNSNLEQDCAMIDYLEPGAGKRLPEYLAKAEHTYNFAMREFVYRNYNNLLAVLKPKYLLWLAGFLKIPIIHNYINQYFTNHHVQQLLEYILVFLGGSP